MNKFTISIVYWRKRWKIHLYCPRLYFVLTNSEEILQLKGLVARHYYLVQWTANTGIYSIINQIVNYREKQEHTR